MVEGLKGRMIVEGTLDEHRILRVVFVRVENKIRVITIYPARRGRY
jgi:uncharacterized DUF497 family protein